MTTLAASAHQRGVDMLVSPIISEALPWKFPSSGRGVPAKYSTVTSTTLNRNPWLPVKGGTAARMACADEDPEVFFGPVDSSEHGKLLSWERKALAICANCLVRQKCLADALRHPGHQQHGVVGGMTAGQRRALLRDGHQKSCHVA
jgi:hypothetical protein